MSRPPKPPKPVKVKISIYLAPHLLEQAQAFAQVDDRALSWVVQRCVEVGLAQVAQSRGFILPAPSAAPGSEAGSEAAQLPQEQPPARTHAGKTEGTALGEPLGLWGDRDPTF